MNQNEVFAQWLKTKDILTVTRNNAWRIMREFGIDDAMAYVMENIIPVENPHNNSMPYAIYGEHLIDENTISQMNHAMRLPVVTKGALMPDAHVGYEVPIGSVIATKNAVIPNAIGVDIACRMRMTIINLEQDMEKKKLSLHGSLVDSLKESTFFGRDKYYPLIKRRFDYDFFKNLKIQKEFDDIYYAHPIHDDASWKNTAFLRQLKSSVIGQLGSSGGGNHFVEWGVFVNNEDNGLPNGQFLAIMSHSGSRRLGFEIAKKYIDAAKDAHPYLNPLWMGLAWLDLDTELGQEYWDAMQLAGRFASANHEVIHRAVMKSAGFNDSDIMSVIENHHNFAWKEIVDGEEMIVHRKGATPAGNGVMGIIPANMVNPAYIVRGIGDINSLNSASHGAGRMMSRTKAKENISNGQLKDVLHRNNVTVLGGGVDEAPMAYKDIDAVMNSQKTCVEVMGKFYPKIVMMSAEKDEND